MLVAVDVGATVSVASAVVGALVAVFGVMGYQSRRARLSTIRSAFNDVMDALASGDRQRELAGAVLLRRFFDPSSELAVRDLIGRRRTPYSGEAVSVIAAVLRGLRSGDLQKLLADGLAYAPTLAAADLQRTNLQGAYLCPRRSHGTLEGADFFRADLGGGSLKKARAANAVFYQARLRGTVFTDADLRGANFFEADLSGAVFKGALLEGASFDSARNVPDELRPLLDQGRTYRSAEPAPGRTIDRGGRQSVFFSLPTVRTAAQEAVCDRLAVVLAREGLEALRLPRSDYPPSDAMSEIYRRVSGCVGVVVFGFHPASSPAGDWAAGATPWTHVEAGMAYACNLPLLVVREEGVASGTFDGAVAGHRTFLVDVDGRWDDEAIVDQLRPWLSELRGW